MRSSDRPGHFARRVDGPVRRLSQMTPFEFLSVPGLWLGLAFAAGFVAVAVQLRRRREGL